MNGMKIKIVIRIIVYFSLKLSYLILKILTIYKHGILKFH